jgi:SPP1 gp7 family putative phage head morphogenesis protein
MQKISKLQQLEIDKLPTEYKSLFDAFFWLNEADLLLEMLLPIITSNAKKAARFAFDQLLEDDLPVASWNIVQDAVLGWARTYAGAEVTLINNRTKNMVQQKVLDWINSGDPLRELEKQLVPEFGIVRARRIAATEVTNAYSGGKLHAWRASNVVEGKKWMTVMDDRVCRICMSLDGQEVGLNEYFIDIDGNQHQRPGAHVNCRCDIRPVVKL